MRPARGVLTLALLVGLAFGGYALAHDRASDLRNAEEVHQAALQRASTATERTAQSRGVQRGSQAGHSAGRRTGVRRGRQRGSRAGARGVRQQAAIAQAAELEGQQQQAAAEQDAAAAEVPPQCDGAIPAPGCLDRFGGVPPPIDPADAGSCPPDQLAVPGDPATCIVPD